MSMVLMVRHAQASFGAADYDRLSELGHRQSRWLGEHFRERGVKFTRVVCGTLVRQRETAEGIVAAMGADRSAIESDAGLNEYPGEALFRAYTGGDQRDAQAGDYGRYWRVFREAMQAWSQDRIAGVPESWAQFGARVNAALVAAASGTQRDDVVLVVSSGGAIGRAVADIASSPASVAIEFNLQFRNTGVCELIWGAGRFRLLSFNGAPHLDHPQRREAITFA
ncbi:MAG: phosphoglycerate mutase family protein [Burkholderiaceae bacterium]|nr:phosphoglycerate mutase family protein [Burkholderiaceae bacterium]